MSTAADPVLTRVRDGLAWRAWEKWHEMAETPPPPVHYSPTDRETRDAAVRRRLDLARTTADGGPYTEIFFDQVHQRLEASGDDPTGPLDGFSFAIKDLLAIEGRTMNAGSAVRADAAPETATAPIITHLESLGAFAIGTVSLHEFAFGVTGINPFAGTAVNPAAPDRIPGGSSSGSAAAVADGSARISIGTDTGGSVRVPASFCGIVGYKPSFGLYPTKGVFPLSGTLDHVGLFAVTSGDITTVHRALGHSVAPTALPTRVGIARSDIDAADEEVKALVDGAITALAAAGVETVDVSWPDAEMTFVTSTTIMFSEAAAIHAPMLQTHGDRYGADIKARLELGRSLTGIEVATAHEYRRRLIADVRTTLLDVDVIIGPTTPMVAPPLTEAADPALPPRVVANTRLGNVVGLPAISIPLPSGSAPVGLQILGGSDAEVLGFATAIEATISS